MGDDFIFDPTGYDIDIDDIDDIDIDDIDDIDDIHNLLLDVDLETLLRHSTAHPSATHSSIPPGIAESVGDEDIDDSHLAESRAMPHSHLAESRVMPHSHLAESRAGFTWVPFPITLKSKTGSHHHIPKPRIGSVQLTHGHKLYGHVFYGESIQDLPNRRDQLKSTFDNVFVIPALSSHAICLNCTTSKQNITMASPITPAPPLSITLLKDRKVQHCSVGTVRKTKLQLDTQIVVPYIQTFFVSMDPMLEAYNPQPVAVTDAFNRMKAFVEKGYGGWVADLTPESDGLELLYDSPKGMKSRWMTTVVLLQHETKSEKEVIDALNVILYFARGVSECHAGIAPVYIAYLQMKRDIYQWKTLAEQKPNDTNVYAHATPPLLNYKAHPLCNPATISDIHRTFSYYTKGMLLWSTHVFQNMPVVVDTADTADTADQNIQWFAPNIYNSVNIVHNISGNQFHYRVDNTSYPIPDVADVVSDLYWSLLPEVDVSKLWYFDETQYVELQVMALKKMESQHRLDWYARYSVVFELQGTYASVEQEGHGPLPRDAHVFWRMPKKVVMLNTVELKPKTIKRWLEIKEDEVVPEGTLKTRMMTYAKDLFEKEKDIRNLQASTDGIGLYFINAYGNPREFPVPVEGRYALRDDTVFTRDDRGEYLFCRNDPFIPENEKIRYGYKKIASNPEHMDAPRLEICRVDDPPVKQDENFFYKLTKYDRDGMADPKGVWIWDAIGANFVDALVPLTGSYNLIPDTLEFRPVLDDDGMYCYVTANERDPGCFFWNGRSYFTTRADGTPVTILFREVNGHFVHVNPKNKWESAQQETRGYFVLKSDLTQGNMFLSGGYDCSF